MAMNQFMANINKTFIIEDVFAILFTDYYYYFVNDLCIVKFVYYDNEDNENLKLKLNEIFCNTYAV